MILRLRTVKNAKFYKKRLKNIYDKKEKKTVVYNRPATYLLFSSNRLLSVSQTKKFLYLVFYVFSKKNYLFIYLKYHIRVKYYYIPVSCRATRLLIYDLQTLYAINEARRFKYSYNLHLSIHLIRYTNDPISYTD